MLIDTHCHIFKEYYNDIELLMSEMKKNNIYAIINGCDYNSNIEVLELSKKHNNIYAAIGIHPSELLDSGYDYIEMFRKNRNEIVAIGEIGLDYYWDKENKKEQIDLFEKQLKFAEEKNLPVIIHNRESTMDIYNILSKYKLKGVIHAFSGSYEMANKFINMGYKLGIGGVLTFKNSKLKDIIKNIDIENIVLETDSPYLTPEPNRGKQNSPMNLVHIAKYISELKNISYEEVCYQTSKNAIQLFDLDLKIW